MRHFGHEEQAAAGEYVQDAMWRVVVELFERLKRDGSV